MDLLDGNFLTVYIGAVLLVLMVGLRMLNQTKRHQQWLFWSFLVGLGIGPLLLLSTTNSAFLDSITLSGGIWRIVELGIVSGLFWSVASTWLASIKQLPAASLAVNVQWLKVAGLYSLLLAVIVVSKNTDIGVVAMLIGAIGLGSILLAARQLRLLTLSAISGVIFIILSAVIAFAAMYFIPVYNEYKIPFTSVFLALPPSSLIGVGILALSSPIISRWWFGQPLGRRV